jgi:hypothetical protein
MRGQIAEALNARGINAPHLGATDRDLAAAFNTTIKCIWDWKVKHPAFGDALKRFFLLPSDPQR